MKSDKEKYLDKFQKEIGFSIPDEALEKEWNEEETRREKELDLKLKKSNLRKNNIAIITGLLGFITSIIAILKAFGYI